MNIASVSNVKFNTYNPLKKKILPFRGQSSVGDSFSINSINPLSKHYSKALDNLTDEASLYIMNAPKITYQGLYDVLEKYSADIQIKKFDNKKAVNKKSIAKYEQNLSYEKTRSGLKEEIVSQIIYVNIPKKQDKTSRADLLGSIIHEAVHMFQYETKINVTGESFIRKYYNSSKSEQEVTDAINQLSNGFAKFEQNIFTLIGNFLNLCIMNSFASENNFNRFLKMGHNMDLAEITKFLIEDAYYESGDNIIETLGEDAITDFVKQKLSREVEAYKAESEVMQKYSPDSTKKTHAKLYAGVYEELLKIASNLKLEKTN